MRALLGTVLIAIGLDVVIAAAWLSRWDHVSAHDRLTFDPTGLSLLRVFPAQLAIGVLGVLIMGSEYATGQIRATLGATPQRGTLLAAKTAVFTVVVFVRGLVTSFVAFFIGQAFFSTKHAGAALSDPGALRAVIGRALYLAAVAPWPGGWAPFCAEPRAVSSPSSACCWCGPSWWASCLRRGAARPYVQSPDQLVNTVPGEFQVALSETS